MLTFYAYQLTLMEVVTKKNVYFTEGRINDQSRYLYTNQDVSEP